MSPDEIRQIITEAIAATPCPGDVDHAFCRALRDELRKRVPKALLEVVSNNDELRVEVVLGDARVTSTIAL